MKETWNVLDPDEYVKHNPFMGYTNMKIEKISPECSEISMKITHGVTNLMGMVHGGMLYALADVVTGLTARADGRKYVTQSAHINFIRNVSEGTVYAKGILIRRGRSITIVRSEVTDEKGNLLADVTVDMFCLGLFFSWKEKNRPNLSKSQEKNLRQLIQACHNRKTPYFQRKFKVSP